MSIEFRLKYIQEAIGKNVNEVLLKWNARKVLLNESFEEDDRQEQCPACMRRSKQNILKYSYVNMDEAIYKCESAACLYPYRNFKYKNFADRTIFRYERVMEMGENKTAEQKMFTSPTKVETDSMDQFNISWLGDTFTDDLDSILSAPTEGQNCDIKDIINNLCNNVETTTSTPFASPARTATGPSPKSSAPKLSKCLQHIEHTSPSKQTNPNYYKTKTPVRRNCTSVKTAIVNRAASSVLKPGTKSFKKIRNGFSQNQQIRPVQSIVKQQPLGFLEWLNAVSKAEPDQIQELKFASLNECNGSSGLATNNTELPTSSTEKSSEPNDIQPIRVELMTPSESLGVDGDQLTSNTRPCLLYQFDQSELGTTNGPLEAISNDQSDHRIAAQTFEHRSSEDHIYVRPAASNVERSNVVSEENVSPNSSIISYEIGTDTNLYGPDDSISNNGQTMQVSEPQDKSKLKIEMEERMEKGDLKEKVQKNLNSENRTLKQKEKRLSKRKEQKKLNSEKRKLEQKQKRFIKRKEQQFKRKTEKLDQIKCNANRKTFNIEVEENFAGFEAVEPFKPITFDRTKELVWLRVE